MVQILPTYDKSQLTETAHYVSNALNNCTQEQLATMLRRTSMPTRKDTKILLDTIQNDLHSTLQSNTIQVAVECGDQDEHEFVNDCNQTENITESTCAESTENGQILNDSITLLKQIVSSENKQNTAPNKVPIKCCDTCNFKPKQKKNRHPMTRCAECMSWFLDQLVGLD